MSTADLLNAIVEKQSATVLETFEQEMYSRILTQLNNRRPEIAKTIFRNINEATQNDGGANRYNTGDRDPASDNIIAQMRRAQDLHQPAIVKFRTGTLKVSPEEIQTVLAYHEKIAKPADKLRYQNAITASPDNFKRVVQALSSGPHNESIEDKNLNQLLETSE